MRELWCTADSSHASFAMNRELSDDCCCSKTPDIQSGGDHMEMKSSSAFPLCPSGIELFTVYNRRASRSAV